MKIPRLTKGPFCWTLKQWATRTAFSDLVGGILGAIIFFYLASVVDNISSNADEDAVAALKGTFIGLGVIFCIPAFFSIILLIGIFKKNTTLHLIWCLYGSAGCIILLILFFAVAIFIFINGNIGLGAIVLVLAFIISGNLVYAVLVVHSLYLDLKEAGGMHTSHAQHS